MDHDPDYYGDITIEKLKKENSRLKRKAEKQSKWIEAVVPFLDNMTDFVHEETRDLIDNLLDLRNKGFD